jgi:Ser/Thr protein kinase RdoA (MazF antagonist)
MLKLKYVMDNRPLVMKILSRWHYDEDSLEILEQYRISSNAVYPFLSNGNVQLLRFYPVSEKPQNSGLAEISFLNYLKESQYPSLRLVPSLHSSDHETIEEAGEEYFACVFEKVPGISIDSHPIRRNIANAAGKALGDLHNLSALYAPDIPRWSYSDVLSYCRQIFHDAGDQDLPILEADFIEKLLNVLPKSKERYGLIHFDFERDNLFYCQDSNTCHVIDFDDAMYHFFAVDVERAIDDITEDDEERAELIEQWFLDGYRSVRPMSDDEIAMFPLFKRFSNLYGYARILRVLQEPPASDADWMQELYDHLNDLLKERSEDFGKPLFGMAIKGTPEARDAEQEDADEEVVFRLMTDSQLLFPVPDPVKTAGFYEDKLRFTAIHNMNETVPSITLTRDGVTIILLQSNSSKVYPNRELYGISLDAYITTKEPDLLQAELIAAEVSIIRPIGVREKSSSREFVFADHDGRWIGVGLKMNS